MRTDPLFQEYMKSREEAEQERTFQKQGELLASVLKDKFVAPLALLDASAPAGCPSLPTPPIPPQMPTQSTFTPEQMEQLRSLISTMLPVAQKPSDGGQTAEPSSENHHREGLLRKVYPSCSWLLPTACSGARSNSVSRIPWQSSKNK